jgi:hypothetical protein
MEKFKRLYRSLRRKEGVQLAARFQRRVGARTPVLVAGKEFRALGGNEK